MTRPTPQLPLPILCQRWRDRRGTYRPGGEPIDPRRFGVEAIDRATAKRFVCQHHYSGSFPAALVCVGLHEARPFTAAKLVGVAVFSQPMSQHAVPKWTNQRPEHGVELGRFVLLDHVQANGETWMLARALGVLRAERPQVRAVISYSDPMERVGDDGTVTCPGHVGTIYQAASAHHAGRTRPSTLILDRHGRAVSARTMSKVRNGDRGAAGAYRTLLAHGAPARRPMESDRDYAARAIAEGPFRRVRHPGNLAYSFPVGGKGQRRAVRAAFPPGRPYVKHAA